MDYKLLNGKDFGVPQNRERIIIIAAKNKKFNFDFIQTISPVPKLRYFLKELGSYTASDRTSKSAGDIEIFDKNKNLIEALEIKLGKKIDLQMILNAKDKIIKCNPRRYYIFSSIDVKKTDLDSICNEI